MIGVNYKYKFWEWMVAQVPRNQHKALRREFSQKLNVVPRTITNWFDMPLDAPYDIPYQAVVYISRRLGHDEKEAPNYTIEVESAV
jgi:hypothetical protein